MVPSEFLHGGALYAPALLTLIVIDAALSRRQPAAGRAMFGATGVFLASITARTLDIPVCQTFPLGTHFLWYILNAVLLYLLIRALILHGSRPGQVCASG